MPILNETFNDKMLPLSNESKCLQQLQELMDQQINNGNADWTLAYFANSLHIGEKTLHRKIREHIQQTPQQYFQAIRLQKAHRLLEENHYSNTKEVAYALGYSNPSYFARIFKKQFGYSPKTLILKLKTQNNSLKINDVTKK